MPDSSGSFGHRVGGGRRREFVPEERSNDSFRQYTFVAERSDDYCTYPSGWRLRPVIHTMYI